MPSRATSTTHFTTRRAFIAATGFGGLSLYGLWAAYGAAPSPLALLGRPDEEHAGAPHGADGPHGAARISQGAHGGHGAAAASPDAAAFRRMTDEFIERYRLPDGTVHPRRLAQAVPRHDAHAGHGGGMTTASEPIEIPMVAGKWYYLPAALRLDAGETYRFRMTALDVSHGASIQFGKGGRMARLRPGSTADVQMTFREPGRYFMYCTVYCGPAHDRMQATIEVA